MLEVVEAEGGEIGVREIARRLELSPTIVQRMVTSLARRGYVDRNAETARYRLGYRALALGANSEHGSDYIVTARRELELLARDQSLNGFIAVLHGGRAVYLLAVQAEGPVAIKVAPGSEMPLHSTAAGKVLLAAQSDAEARKLLGTAKLAAITPHTVTDPAAVVARSPRCASRVSRPSRGEYPRRAVGRRPDPRPHRQDAGGAERRLPEVPRRSSTLQSVTPLVVAAAQRISRAVGGMPVRPLGCASRRHAQWSADHERAGGPRSAEHDALRTYQRTRATARGLGRTRRLSPSVSEPVQRSATSSWIGASALAAWAASWRSAPASP